MVKADAENQLSRNELVEAWAKVYGLSPPKGLSTRLLTYAYHYNRQIKNYGGLRKTTLRQLMQHVPAVSGTAQVKAKLPAAVKPATGTRLVREWRGRTHMVDIEENCFVYQGKSYRSLSAIARAITGARWSGPRFFGL